MHGWKDMKNGMCGGIVDFEIEVLPVPEFELDDYVAFCDYDLVKSYKFYGDFDSYTWTDEEGNIIGNSNEVIFPSEGIYTLKVTSADLECPATREIEVIFDEAPVILEIFVDGHMISITSAGGEPPVQYSYDNGLIWHASPVIYDLPGGVYDLIAKSKYGCISQPVTFGVLGVPNVITPNGDGKNDRWQIRGVSEFPNAHIKIFDRFGKMFVDRPLTTEFQWDGKYMGRSVPSGDYWYLIILEDGRKISGHISVRNQ